MQLTAAVAEDNATATENKTAGHRLKNTTWLS